MTHLDIVEQTPDRLVLRRQRSRGDQVVTGLVFATIVGFSVWALWLVAVSGDRLLAAGLIGFLALMGWSTSDEEEVFGLDRMIQEIYRGLSKMEERVEALETLLMDRHRQEQQ